MPKDFERFGLVLSGGGARGAYEVGVARYMKEHGLTPAAYAGASIGALNAVFLATASSFEEGVNRMEEVWLTLEADDVLRVNNQFIIYGFLLVSFKKMLINHPGLAILESMLKYIPTEWKHLERVGQLVSENPISKKLKEGLLDNSFLQQLLGEELGIQELDAAPMVWISAYESRGTARDVLEYALAGVGVKDTRDSHYFLLNKLPAEQRLSVVLSSAAIPVVYGSQVVQGKRYVDGGLGGAMTSKGNTPIKPLVDAGYSNCIVVNLSDGSFFNRNDFPGTTIIEVRPQHSLHPNGFLSSMFNFRRERIQELIEQGYEDAKRCIGDALTAVRLVHRGRTVAEERDNALARMEGDGFAKTMHLLD
ncbi:patatin-like phospholipase family protein [Paenibacillus cymbidii]|uniref:patatin-like phospholipase family protein n=1 Tax=Paenibacillus cymbidii TaxID=1639034 RepID=UPI0010822405|nr:patatin-like phospholipase family protein [Paenibacillus cymbidii]